MPRNFDTAVVTIGIDPGKNTLHLVGSFASFLRGPLRVRFTPDCVAQLGWVRLQHHRDEDTIMFSELVPMLAWQVSGARLARGRAVDFGGAPGRATAL
jgi:hypothetical protein